MCYLIGKVWLAKNGSAQQTSCAAPDSATTSDWGTRRSTLAFSPVHNVTQSQISLVNCFKLPLCKKQITHLKDQASNHCAQAGMLCTAAEMEAYFFFTSTASMVPSWKDLAAADLNRDGGVSIVSKRCRRFFMQTG